MDRTASDKQFGQRLRELARRQYWTLADVASYAGLSNAYVQRLARGEQRPSWDAVCAIADALGVCVSEFRDRR